MDASLELIMGNSLIMLEGDKWRNMRSTLSPAFTGNKMRQMFQLIVECSERTVDVLRSEAAASDGPWVPELRELFSYFANDVIATAAFGVEVNSVQDKQNEFYKLGKKSLDIFSVKFMFRSIWAAIRQNISPNLKARAFPSDVVEFFDTLVHGTIAARQKDNIFRPDMIQLLMAASEGTLDESPKTGNPIRKEKPTWTKDDITAQCYLFFLAGFETISGTLSFVCQQIIENPSCKTRLIAEVDDLRRKLNGRTISYDDLAELKYMDMVISGEFYINCIR